MRKLILLLTLIPLITTTYAQRAYFSTGSNFSTFNFNSPSPMSTPLINGTGSNHEMGVSIVLKPDNLSYSVGVNLNEYNAMAGDFANSYSWNTKFLGLNNSIDYSISLIGNFRVIFQGGLNLSTIVYGQQVINGAYFDLIKQEEFSRLNLTPHVHLAFTAPIKDIGFMSLGYGINKSFFPMNNSEEKLSITTNQFVFGLHFNIN
ncbi:MAG: hypothetical protein WCH03_07470 [Flavobacteriia bacterium]